MHIIQEHILAGSQHTLRKDKSLPQFLILKCIYDIPSGACRVVLIGDLCPFLQLLHIVEIAGGYLRGIVGHGIGRQLPVKAKQVYGREGIQQVPGYDDVAYEEGQYDDKGGADEQTKDTEGPVGVPAEQSDQGLYTQQCQRQDRELDGHQKYGEQPQQGVGYV